jgi:quercetin dioxygenase-like cupin family protein
MLGVLISGTPPEDGSKRECVMKRLILSAGLLAGGIVVGLSSPESIRAQVPGYVTKQVFKTDLVNLPGQEVIIYASEWPSGFQLPLHLHEEGHEFVYVIEGEQTFEIDGVGTKVVKAGEVVYTPPNTKHFGRSATDRPSKTLVFRIKAKDKPVMTEVK